MEAQRQTEASMEPEVTARKFLQVADRYCSIFLLCGFPTVQRESPENMNTNQQKQFPYDCAKKKRGRCNLKFNKSYDKEILVLSTQLDDGIQMI